jgi:crossover junction endodeoxyribonuclease RusA
MARRPRTALKIAFDNTTAALINENAIALAARLKTQPLNVMLPFPPSTLNPNRKFHWAEKHKAAKSFKANCIKALHAAGLRSVASEKLNLLVVFNPPDKIRRDQDNLIAAFKHGQDAIAHVTGIDDNNFRVTYDTGLTFEQGCVAVQISVAA